MVVAATANFSCYFYYFIIYNTYEILICFDYWSFFSHKNTGLCINRGWTSKYNQPNSGVVNNILFFNVLIISKTYHLELFTFLKKCFYFKIECNEEIGYQKEWESGISNDLGLLDKPSWLMLTTLRYRSRPWFKETSSNIFLNYDKRTIPPCSLMYFSNRKELLKNRFVNNIKNKKINLQL